MDLKVVPDRECGACNVCCDLPSISSRRLRKLPGVLCEHWALGVGCSIYHKRPKICREHLCGWRLLDGLDESWRPDLSRIYIRFNPGPAPDYAEQMPQACLHAVFGLLGELDDERVAELATVCATLIGQNIPVFLMVACPPGHARRMFPLNAVLQRFLTADKAVLAGAMKMAICGAAQMPLVKVHINETDGTIGGSTIFSEAAPGLAASP